MIACLIATACMPFIERRIGTSKTGMAGLSFGTLCAAIVTTSFFLEAPLRNHHSQTLQTVNSVITFAGMIIARLGHVTFDLAQVSLSEWTQH